MSESNGIGVRGHVLFVWSPAGYTIREHAGEPPAVGDLFEDDGRTLVVTKLGASPIPSDPRPCVYTVGA